VGKGLRLVIGRGPEGGRIERSYAALTHFREAGKKDLLEGKESWPIEGRHRFQHERREKKKSSLGRGSRVAPQQRRGSKKKTAKKRRCRPDMCKRKASAVGAGGQKCLLREVNGIRREGKICAV